MNKIARFKQRHAEVKVLRADEAIIHNAKAMLSAREQIDAISAGYLSGELCLADVVSRIADVDKFIDEHWQTVSYV